MNPIAFRRNLILIPPALSFIIACSAGESNNSSDAITNNEHNNSHTADVLDTNTISNSILDDNIIAISNLAYGTECDDARKKCDSIFQDLWAIHINKDAPSQSMHYEIRGYFWNRAPIMSIDPICAPFSTLMSDSSTLSQINVMYGVRINGASQELLSVKNFASPLPEDNVLDAASSNLNHEYLLFKESVLNKHGKPDISIPLPKLKDMMIKGMSGEVIIDQWNTSDKTYQTALNFITYRAPAFHWKDITGVITYNFHLSLYIWHASLHERYEQSKRITPELPNY